MSPMAKFWEAIRSSVSKMIAICMVKIWVVEKDRVVKTVETVIWIPHQQRYLGLNEGLKSLLCNIVEYNLTNAF